MAATAKPIKKEEKKVEVQEEDDSEDISDIDIEDEAEEDEDVDPGLTDPETVTKYKLASDMANRTMER